MSIWTTAVQVQAETQQSCFLLCRICCHGYWHYSRLIRDWLQEQTKHPCCLSSGETHKNERPQSCVNITEWRGAQRLKARPISQWSLDWFPTVLMCTLYHTPSLSLLSCQLKVKKYHRLTRGWCDGVNVALPAETGRFQENVGTERCPQGGRSLDHQVLPVHLAPGRCEKEEDKFIPTVKGHISVLKLENCLLMWTKAVGMILSFGISLSNCCVGKSNFLLCCRVIKLMRLKWDLITCVGGFYTWVSSQLLSCCC